jgi:PTH2 family peptidyl-tRNA hydrolase
MHDENTAKPLADLLAKYYIPEELKKIEANIVTDYPKQIIVMRQYFPDGKGGTKKLRIGKYVAQGCHASQLALKEARLSDSPACWDWLNHSFAKIVLYVKTEQELLDLAKAVKAAGLPFGLVQDSGRTEFEGIPTYTALGIGPSYSSEIDPLTKHLPLF